MKEIYRSKYDVIYVDETHGIVKNEWQPATINMTWDEFKFELIELKKIVVANKTKGILGDTKLLQFSIAPEYQTWIAENYFPEVLAAGLKKYGIIVSTDLLTELSVEQTIEEVQANPFESKYFDTQEKAYKWLIS